MNLSDALGELGTLLGLGRLQFNEHGLCRLNFDQSLTADLEADPDGVTLHLCGTLGRLPSGEASQETYLTLLDANFLGEGTGGGYFALDGDELLFLRTLNTAVADFSTLAAAVESFVNFYDGWGRKLRESGAATGAGIAASAAHAGPNLRV